MTVEGVCGAFGLTGVDGASVSAASRGAAGQVWRLELGADRYAVKELFAGFDEESVRAEVAFTEHLLAAGIRLPVSVPAATGRYVAPVAGGTEGFAIAGGGGAAGGAGMAGGGGAAGGSGAAGGAGMAGGGGVAGGGGMAGGGGRRWLRLYRWVDGVTADLGDAATAGRVGGLLGRLHLHALPWAGESDPWFEVVPDAGAWGRLAEAGRAQGAGWADELAGRTHQLGELAEFVTAEDPRQLVTCHRDLHPDNVLVDGSGELVVLDWDDYGPASPDRELAAVLAFWLLDEAGQVDEDAVGRMLAGYHAAGGPGRLRDERAFGMYIAGRLNFLQAQAGLALDAGVSPENRAHAAFEISDTLARLPAPPLISRIVDLAGRIHSRR